MVHYGKNVAIEAILPAGSVKNINPLLLVEAIGKRCCCELFSDITRRELYTEDFLPFK